MSQTTNQILKSIRRRAMLPDSNSTFSKDDLLDMVDEELRYFAVPHILQSKEDFLVDYVDYPLNDTGIYDIPYRAIGQKLKDVYLLTSTNAMHETSRINVDDIAEYQTTYASGFFGNIFYLQDNQIIFPSTISGNYSKVRVYYFLSPNKLVDEAKVGKITNIDRNTGIITLSSFPENFANLPEIDFITFKNPNKILDYDIVPTAVNSNNKTITFAIADIPDSLSIKDYITQAQETIVLQLPEEFQHIIAQRVAVQALESLGDEQNKQGAEKRLEKMEIALTQLVANRVDGAPEKIKPRRSLLRQSLRSKYYKKGLI